MKNSMKNIVKIMILFFLIISFFCTFSLAGNFDLNIQPNDSDLGSAKTLLESGAGTVITIIRVIGAGVALIVILVLAMKYMMAAPSDRADVKKSAIPYLIGAFIFFGASQILTVLMNVSKEVKGS